MVQPIRPQDATGIYQRQVAQTEAAEAVAAQRGGSRGAAGGRRADQVTLSEGAHAFVRAMDAVTAQPDVRADRVAQLRARLEAGTYQVDASRVARRLYDHGLRP